MYPTPNLGQDIGKKINRLDRSDDWLSKIFNKMYPSYIESNLFSCCHRLELNGQQHENYYGFFGRKWIVIFTIYLHMCTFSNECPFSLNIFATNKAWLLNNETAYPLPSLYTVPFVLSIGQSNAGSLLL